MITTGKKKIQSSVGGHLAVFLLWREIFITTGKKKIHYDRKKKRYSRLSDGCAVLAITTGKKRYSRLSGGLCCCISFWFWREISIFCVVAGNFDYDRKKKDTVICWREISSFFVVVGNFHYGNEFVLVLAKIDLIHFEH